VAENLLPFNGLLDVHDRRIDDEGTLGAVVTGTSMVGGAMPFGSSGAMR
jgi:hypothetical protein